MSPRVSVALHPAFHARPVEIRLGGLGRPARTLRLTAAEAEALLPLLRDTLSCFSAGHPAGGGALAPVMPMADAGMRAPRSTFFYRGAMIEETADHG